MQGKTTGIVRLFQSNKILRIGGTIMKGKKFLWSFLTVIMLLSMTVGAALAEDGDLFRKNISKTPDNETEKAAIYMMDFYVPAQASTGLVGPVDNYLLADETTSGYEARNYAKPLVTAWIDDLHPVEETKGGVTFGHFDAFIGISLDDGTSWKTTNLSRSSDLSSFTLKNGYAYPGDVHNVVHQVFNDNIFVAWVGKYCEGGTPLYSLKPVEEADYFADLEETYEKDAVYLYDLFGVGGAQSSVDYKDQGFPEVGEIPFSCVWTARGKLLAGDDPATTESEATYVMWTKPERLTSGKRDANLPAVDCAAGAGCILTWQEDPEGLRPGQGLGPGEGWSGAVANQQTDIWYSHISQAEFDLVFSAEDVIGAIPMSEYALLTDVTMPKPYVPMAAPVRLTDNAMCKGTSTEKSPSAPYCYIDFDTIDDIDHTNIQTLLDLEAPEADADFCADQVDWLNPGGTTLKLCVTEDNRLLNGRVAATRVRLNLKPYTLADGTKSAWVVMAAEESKALGEVLDEDGDPIDIGKDIWYYSFDPFKTGADEFMVNQGGLLNQPAVCKDEADEHCTTVGEFYDVQVDTRGFDYYLTEISRRFALTTNSVSAAVNSESGLSAMLIYKQGIINQGGPADIMLRRTLIPDEFDATVDNPYAFENMECAEWAYSDGLNPNYLQGVCLSPAINITGTTVIRCDAGNDNDTCADAFPMADDGSNPDGTAVPKVYEWRQCDGGTSIDGCEDDNDLDDQTWENPYDVAKGHRGFLDGDFVMMMYAWAPNWNSNTVGNDHYNLYTRRSFDGGATWTTTPSVLGGEGTEYLEYYYGTKIGEPVPVTWTYGAGEFEQGRNVSLLTGNKVTILDPRYSPTGGMKLYPTISTWFIDLYGLNTYGDTLPYDDDAVRDPSKFFMVYETGDNTTVAEGEATPLDLYYSRATVYGDVWEVMDYVTDKDDLVLDRWPWLENKSDILSGEAGMLANPGGTFMYSVWNQWEEEITHWVDEYGLEHEEELVFNSDIIFRRLMYLPDDTTLEVNLPPVASILATSQEVYGVTEDQIISLLATARDLDKMGDESLDPIQEYVWTINGVAVPVEFQEEFKDMGFDCFQDKQCNAPARVVSGHWDGYQFQQPGWSGQNNYNLGWYEFALQVKDNDDPAKWSKIVKVKKYIANSATDLPGFKIFLPLTTK
ncbi:MAG: hypothetical protein CVU40_07615 [Chloroflexi bacterium HGW-Chloroflexi-2]|jgi:hypothetical protein|nr:MAG: hypothetical protein CVU40_07615 [Chloroflexi bacterium HGW-Chloroflexi-2]